MPPGGSVLTLRAARGGDVPQIIRVCKASIAETYGFFIDAEKLEPWVNGNEVEKFIDAHLANVVVAERGDRILGVICVSGNVIDLLWVDIDFRGQGVGTRLMEEVEKEVFGRHAETRVECFEPNVRSMAFYEERGYRAVNRSLDPESGVNKVLMVKRI
jgi:putative acetyltransferase